MRVALLFFTIIFSLPAFSQLFDNSIEGGVSTIRSYRLLTNTNNTALTVSTITFRNTFEEPINSYGAFFGYTKNIKKRVFLNGELKYQRLGYATNLIQNRVFGGNAPLPSLSLDFIDVYHITSLNVSAGYVFIKKEKTNVYASGGLGIDFMISNYIKRLSNGTSTTTIPDSYYNSKRVNMSVQFGLGILRKLTNNSALKFDFAYSRNLLNFNTDPIGLQLVYASFNIGYVFNLDTP